MKIDEGCSNNHCYIIFLFNIVTDSFQASTPSSSHVSLEIDKIDIGSLIESGIDIRHDLTREEGIGYTSMTNFPYYITGHSTDSTLN